MWIFVSKNEITCNSKIVANDGDKEEKSYVNSALYVFLYFFTVVRRDQHYGSMGAHIRQVVRSAERPTNFRTARVAG